jgi:hypothetical protein
MSRTRGGAVWLTTRWMAAHPDAISFAAAWADRNLDELTRG